MALFGKKNDKNNEKNNEENENIQEENASVNEEKASEKSASEESALSAVPEKNDGGSTVPEPETVTKPMYETPENFDFNRYFLAERRVILDNVSYETERPTPGQINLNVKDTIVAQVMGQAGVKVTYNRTLSFEPQGPFRLSVTFGVMLVFNPGTRGEVDWHRVDVANEFKKNCPGLVDLMASKAALIVAELTNASGGNPIILRK